MTEDNKTGQSAADANDMYSALGPVYKRTFNKMMGNKNGGEK